MAVLKRAIKEKDKLKRKEKILDIARDLFEKNDGTLPTISEIAKKAGLSKGSVYLYFKTKNEIFLSLYMNQVKMWHDSIATALKEHKGEITPSDYASLVSHYVIRNPLVLKMWGVINGFFDGTTDEEMFIDFKTQLAELMNEQSKMISKFFPGLPTDQWINIQVKIYALIFGLWQVFYSPTQVKKLLRETNVNLFELDFSKSVVDSVTTFLTGALQNTKIRSGSTPS